MLDAFTRAIRKPQHVLGYVPDMRTVQLSPPGVRIRREPDGPVSIRIDTDTNCHIPSPFRIGYGIKCYLLI